MIFDVLMAGCDSHIDLQSFVKFCAKRTQSPCEPVAECLEDPRVFEPEQQICMKDPIFSSNPKLEATKSKESIVLPKSPHPATYQKTFPYFPVKTDSVKVVKNMNQSKTDAAITLFSVSQTKENCTEFLTNFKILKNTPLEKPYVLGINRKFI
ncbi:MAG: hypothetical protein MHMPM18_005049 [Marteilia pararefringens]